MSEAFFYFQRATAHHFPDMMQTNANHANDNPYEKGLAAMAGEQLTPFESMMVALDSQQLALQNQMQVINHLVNTIEDLTRRVIDLEEMIDG